MNCDEMETPPAAFEQCPLGYGHLFIGLQFTSVGRTVTEADIGAFAGVSGDFNQLHTDDQWVKANTSFDGRIAHGILVLAMSSGMRTPGYDDLVIHAYLSTQRDMTHPTYPGDTLTVVSTVKELKPSRSRPGSGVATVEVEVHNQDGAIVQKGTDVFLIGEA